MYILYHYLDPLGVLSWGFGGSIQGSKKSVASGIVTAIAFATSSLEASDVLCRGQGFRY